MLIHKYLASRFTTAGNLQTYFSRKMCIFSFKRDLIESAVYFQCRGEEKIKIQIAMQTEKTKP
jgi:hypothetical protein